MRPTTTLFMTAALLSATVPTHAAPVAIVNPGFEDPYLAGNLPAEYNGDVPATAFPVGGAPNGWAPFGDVGPGRFIGVLNPGVMALEPLATNFPDGAPEGDNVALMYADGYQGGPEFGIEQTLDHTLQGQSRYTLTVEVGNIASGVSVVAPYSSFGFYDLRGFPGYRIDLLAGDQLIAQDLGSLSPGEGEFELSELRLASVDLDPALIGQQLTIRLVNTHNQDLDDPAVRGLEVDFDDVRLETAPLLPGDATLDGVVDILDLDAIAFHFGAQQDAMWTTGDFNGDGAVDILDLDILSGTFGSVGVAAVASIPEPSAIVLMGLCGVALIRTRGR